MRGPGQTWGAQVVDQKCPAVLQGDMGAPGMCGGPRGAGPRGGEASPAASLEGDAASEDVPPGLVLEGSLPGSPGAGRQTLPGHSRGCSCGRHGGGEQVDTPVPAHAVTGTPHLSPRCPAYCHLPDTRPGRSGAATDRQGGRRPYSQHGHSGPPHSPAPGLCPSLSLSPLGPCKPALPGPHCTPTHSTPLCRL